MGDSFQAQNPGKIRKHSIRKKRSKWTNFLTKGKNCSRNEFESLEDEDQQVQTCQHQLKISEKPFEAGNRTRFSSSSSSNSLLNHKLLKLVGIALLVVKDLVRKSRWT